VRWSSAVNSIKELPWMHNTQNQKISKDNTPGFRGVTFVKRKGTWPSRATIKGKVKNLGYFYSPEEAAMARCICEDQYPDWWVIIFKSTEYVYVNSDTKYR
jgi:hypothetical protein